ncbi:MAG TPA: hypothetical protein ENJ39_02310 [Flammeovirgaceae bacterium]|nr:hypothetical protein [Flammeovirgaceae bacterium]
MKKIIVSIAIVLLAGSASLAQQRSLWSFNYLMSFGVGEQADYIGKGSFRGFGIDGRGFLQDNLSIGGTVSWEVFHEIFRNLPPQPFEINDPNTTIKGDITGVQYRYINTIPIMVNAHYYLGSDGAVRPYFGLGIGTNYTERRTEIGLTAFQSNTWRFAVQPEVGIYVPFGLSSTGLNVTARFRYAPKTSNDSLPISFFSLGVGFAFAN